MSGYPKCDGCGAEIIGIGPGAQPWRVVVRAPDGVQRCESQFCGSCMVEMARCGLRLLPAPRVPKLIPLGDDGERAYMPAPVGKR